MTPSFAASLGRYAAAIAAGVSVAAVEGSATFLLPDRFSVPAADPIPLRIETAIDGAAPTVQPWPGDSVRRLFLRIGGTQDNMHRAVPPQGRKTFDLVPSHAGIAMIGLDLKESVVPMSGRDFLVAAPADDCAPAARTDREALRPEAAVRVRKVDSAKTIVRVGDASDPAYDNSAAVSKGGTNAEIRPMFDPTKARPGSDLLLRTFCSGSARSGVRVTAVHAGSGESQKVSTNSEGLAYIHIAAAGVYRVSFVRAEQADQVPDADWVLYTATLTFETPDGPGENPR